jgi:hypothetical protein
MQHDAEIQDVKERNFALVKKVEVLETSDLVKAVRKGSKIPIGRISVNVLHVTSCVCDKPLTRGRLLASDISQEEREKLEKDLREQEVLIAAYQKENERLLNECKTAQAGARDKDHHLFIENQRLQQRNKTMEDQLQHLLLRTSQNVGGDLANKLELARVVDELEETRRRHTTQVQELKFEIDRVRKAKKEMEAQLGGVDVPKMQSQAEDVKVLEKQISDLKLAHEREKTDLEARLSWYSENQEIVNKNDELLKAQDAKIQSLQHELEKVASENQELNHQLDLSGANGETKQVKVLKKKIATLETQIKDIQSEPNVVRDLIRAAQPSAEESKELEALHARIATLEKDATQLSEDAERRMRGLRQEMESQRTAYEKRMSTLQTSNKELSNKLVAKGPAKDVAPLSSKDQQKQVGEVRTHYQKKIKELQRQLSETQEQLASAKAALERRGGNEEHGIKSHAVQELEQRIAVARERIPRTPVKGAEDAHVSDGNTSDGGGVGGDCSGEGGVDGENKPCTPRRAGTAGAPSGQEDKWAAPRGEAGKGDAGKAIARGGRGKVVDAPAAAPDASVDPRILELENQLRMLKGGGGGSGGGVGGMGVLGGWGGGYGMGYASMWGAGDAQREILVLQQRLAESKLS